MDKPLSLATSLFVSVARSTIPARLKTVAAPGHVLIMLADPEISVSRFFERPDREKQFLYRLLTEEPDPEAFWQLCLWALQALRLFCL